MKYNNHQTLSEQFKLFLLIMFFLHLQQCFYIFLTTYTSICKWSRGHRCVCVTQHTSHTSSTLFCSKSCRLCNDTTKCNLNNYHYDLKNSHTHTGKHEHTFPSVAQWDVSEDQNNKKKKRKEKQILSEEQGTERHCSRLFSIFQSGCLRPVR